MKVIRIDDSTVIHNETASSIGFFDGVHRGHRYLIEQLKENAQLLGLPTSIITFSNHPKKVLQSKYPLKLLNSFDERMKQLASTGINYCYVMHFTEAFSEITAESFIRRLSRELKIQFLLIGYDHRFGNGRSHTFEHYLAFGKTNNIIVDRAKELPKNTEPSCSSTIIRQLLQEGKVEKAAELLSYNYPLEGNVIHGDQLGRSIGFPTANIELIEKEKLIPKEGVYAGIVYV
jgi:riboflavin kinase/FMN adenylyltransferase